MSTSAKTLARSCPTCIITINWTHVEVYAERAIEKAPTDTSPPSPPSECNVYPPGAGPYMTSDPYWDKDRETANYNHRFVKDYYIGASRDCIKKAFNVQKLDKKTATREENKGTTNPSVDFWWQCSQPNPNPPPPEILTTAGPVNKSFQRKNVDEYTDEYTFYQGQIICHCHEPKECGCK